MDQTEILRTTLLALDETVRGLATKLEKPSFALKDQINSVLKAVSQQISGAHFPKFDAYPDPSEVLPQIKLALQLLPEASGKSAESKKADAIQDSVAASHQRMASQWYLLVAPPKGLREAKIIKNRWNFHIK